MYGNTTGGSAYGSGEAGAPPPRSHLNQFADQFTAVGKSCALFLIIRLERQGGIQVLGLDGRNASLWLRRDQFKNVLHNHQSILRHCGTPGVQYLDGYFGTAAGRRCTTTTARQV